MAHLKAKKDKLNEKRKLQAIRNWLSSFLVTTVVVVTAIVSNPVVPTAEFLSLETAGTAIYYAVVVNDEESVLSEDSLKIVAKSSLQTKEKLITVGQTEGVLEDLLPNTEYTISVVGSKGYGEFSLEKQTIITEQQIDNYYGEIVSADFSLEDQEMMSCDINVSFHNNGEIKELNLKYAYFFTDVYDQVGEPEYTIITVTEENFYYTIEYLPRMNGYLNIILEATLQDDTVTALDEQTIYSPIIINAGVYLEYVGETQISVTVYPDTYLSDTSYYAILKKDNIEIQQQNVEIYQQQYYSMGYVTFYDLEPNAGYELEFYITYTNPNTLIQETQMFSTLSVITQIYYPPVY